MRHGYLREMVAHWGSTVPYYLKFSQHFNFVNFAIFLKSQNLSDVNNKCCEHNMTGKISEWQDINNSE